MPESNYILLGDIGGTNARLAIKRQEDPCYTEATTLQTAGHPNFVDAVDSYLQDLGLPKPNAICIAAAGPQVDGTIRLTNSTWNISATALQAHYQCADVQVLNDFEALAHALPALTDDDILQIGGPSFARHRQLRVGVIGPGTGLGAAALLQTDKANLTLVTEAGHVGFAPESARQSQIRDRLMTRHKRVSDERLISGQGIENIYWAMSPEDARIPAAEVFERCTTRTDPIATSAVEEFFEILGQIAGNFALSTGCYDGIFIAGGIVRRHLALLDTQKFRAAFENKGRHAELMQRIPTYAITLEQPGLLGVTRACTLF